MEQIYSKKNKDACLEQEPSRVCVWCFTFTVHLFFEIENNNNQEQSGTVPVHDGYQHQPVLLFSQNKPATSNQYFSLRTNQHRPPASSQTNRLNGEETRPYLQAADLLALLVWHCHAHGERLRADLSSSSLLMNRPVSVLWKIETRDNRPWHVPQVKLCYLIQAGLWCCAVRVIR
jgi:hypothetical protein